jgi:transposase
MKMVAIEHPDLTRENLLELAEQLPGAWLGIRIAAFLLLLQGWKPTAVCELFGFSRTALWKWGRAANQQGLAAWQERARPGRAPRLRPEQQRQLELALQQPPERFGFSQARWDGPLVVRYVRQGLKVELRVRQAQRWLHRLGFALIQPTYRYGQARRRGVGKFLKTVKKNSVKH